LGIVVVVKKKEGLLKAPGTFEVLLCSLRIFSRGKEEVSV
jgi:hypothetical protein